MANLIDGLLAFSRLSQLPLDRRRVDVEALAREAADSLDAGNGSTSAISIGHLPAARADPTLLRQVFANLLSNAIKFTRDEPDPRIEVGSYADNGSSVYVVRDNGVGFDMRHADKIFTVFQRLHRQEDYEGTGIGLALVARIVARHGGRIWVDASPGEGAAFHFTLDGGEA
jgi:light-regulated signal transduction histidine kinase (bacteriophytochrome)